MPRFLLLMRGDQTEFLNMSNEEKKVVIQSHIDYSKELEKKKILMAGDGLSNESILLGRSEHGVKEIANPFTSTLHQLSGFYIIEAKDHKEAVAIAKQCPALQHGETVEVIEMGH